MKVKEFAKLLTEEYGAISRRIMVLPADKNNGKKRPFGEDSSLDQEEIAKSVWCEKLKTMTLPAGCEKSHSLYLKHMPDLYCVDFDVKEFKDAGFYDYLMERDVYRCQTTKGSHFYIKVPDIKPFTNEVKIGASGDDIDFIKRKRNMWENDSRTIEGSGFGDLKWDDIRKFFNEPKMNFGGIKASPSIGDLSAPDDEPLAPEEFVIIEKTKCDEETMKMYLGRLAKWRCDNYDSWITIGLAIHHNFSDDSIAGWSLFDEWSKTNEKYQSGICREKWGGFKNDCEEPMSYRTIKMWADEDDPQNELESIYKEKGEDAMVRHMNRDVIFRKQFSDYIHIFCLEDMNYEVKEDKKMKNSYMTEEFKIQIGDKAVVKNPFDIWCHNRFRASVHKIDFDPTNTMPQIFNLWNGYHISEGTQNGQARPLCYHIKNVWCSGNETYYEYVMDWFAWVLQKPERKIGVMMCVKSRQGTGKGIVLSVMDQIMNGSRQNGPYAQMSNVDSILGQWSYGIEGKTLVNFDEAYWGGNKKLEGQVKNLITEPNQEIRKKHQAPYFIKNTTAFITTTNNEYFAGITADDRRNFCLEADSDFVDDLPDKIAYFETITRTEQGDDPHPDVVQDFAHILYNRDITGFKPSLFEKTALAQEQIQQGWNSVLKWWHRVLETGIVRKETAYDGCSWEDMPGKEEQGCKGITKDWMYESYAGAKVAGYSSYHEPYDNFCRKTKAIFSEKAMPAIRRGVGANRIHVYMVPLDIALMKKEFNRSQKYAVF